MYNENLLGLNFKEESKKFLEVSPYIIDIHSHINGGQAAAIYRTVAQLFGIGRVYSMTYIDGVKPVQEALGDLVRFIAIPKFFSENPIYDHGEGFIRVLDDFYQLGSRIVKFWSAPRGLDFSEEYGVPGLMTLTSPQRLQVMQAASDLGMIFMAHVSDPDTWFQTKYSDAKRYGTKVDQYKPLDDLLAKFSQPWILAHMGGWPENLEFLSELLNRHSNLYLDTSATKWMVRELSKHSRDDLLEFLTCFKGRILFGSDIVTADAHVSVDAGDSSRGTQASTKEQAFDLYASRYWSLRTLFETDYDGPSTIADGDLQLVNPEQYGPQSAPQLSGKKLPAELLQTIYYQAAFNLLG